jgi:hypothetical protein
MRNPQRLREQAELCREMSARRGGHTYLLELASRFEAEAVEIDRRMAGQHPERIER